MTSLTDHLKCPICLEIPPSLVFQCKNGHTFCSTCSSKLSLCPQCRAILGHDRIRNRTLEELLDLFNFNCPNKSLGCLKQLKRFEIATHLQFCSYEPFFFCKLLGFQDCSWDAKKSSQILPHLRQVHSILETEIRGAFCLSYENIIRANSSDNDSVTVWTPQLVRNEKDILLFLCQTNKVTKNIAWMCLSMAETTPVLHYKIGSTDKDELLSPRMKWKASAMPFKDIENELEHYAIRLPFSVLSTLSNGTLRVEIKLCSDQEQTAKSPRDMKEVKVCELVTFKPRHIQHESLSEDDVVFNHVYCNSCGQRPLTKLRYKCLQCLDYDLCTTCIENRIHSHHVFARIQSLEQNNKFNLKHKQTLKKGKSSYI